MKTVKLEVQMHPVAAVADGDLAVVKDKWTWTASASILPRPIGVISYAVLRLINRAHKVSSRSWVQHLLETAGS